MIREALANLHWSYLPVVSMMMFFGVFLGVLIWVYRKESHRVYHEMGTLPLQEDQRFGGGK